MNKYLLVLFVLGILGCSQEEEDPTTPPPIIFEYLCLTEMELEISEYRDTIINCEFIEWENCDSYTYLGQAYLSEYSKINFVDFCPASESKIHFNDINNTIIEGTIGEKKYQTNKTEAIVGGSDCRLTCLDVEEATTEIFSDRFNLSFKLHNKIDYVDTSLTFQFEGTVLEIIAWGDIDANGTRRGQTVFILPWEDHNYEPIIPDTSRVRYHEAIMLNDTLYSNLYSNENYTAQNNGPKRKEKIYFHPTDGLVGVRDSLGVLWTRHQ